jgi:prepilin-type N-terminal cleavage/methylation domain-containing protein
MKLPFTIYDLRFTIWKKSAESDAVNRQSVIKNHKFRRGFTMAEIAISLAIIGIALVAIIGVLPLGMRIQRDNRETTVINQDATVFMEAIRGGARGMDDLTNYVFMITNTYAHFAYSNFTSGAEIIGLLGTPEFVDAFGDPIPYPGYSTPSYSNRMVAFVYSMSGPAVEKPPQANGSLIRQSSFSYGLICENLPVPTDTNNFNLPPANPKRIYSEQLAANLRELRLTFLWPLLPDSQPPRVHYGTGQQTYRAMVAGQIVQTNVNSQPPYSLYFFQSQSFTNAP